MLCALGNPVEALRYRVDLAALARQAELRPMDQAAVPVRLAALAAKERRESPGPESAVGRLQGDREQGLTVRLAEVGSHRAPVASLQGLAAELPVPVGRPVDKQSHRLRQRIERPTRVYLTSLLPPAPYDSGL
jgi:hypothetical protein